MAPDSFVWNNVISVNNLDRACVRLPPLLQLPVASLQLPVVSLLHPVLSLLVAVAPHMLSVSQPPSVYFHMVRKDSFHVSSRNSNSLNRYSDGGHTACCLHFVDLYILRIGIYMTSNIEILHNALFHSTGCIRMNRNSR